MRDKEFNVNEELENIMELKVVAKRILMFKYKNESYRNLIIKQILQLIITENKVYNEFLMNLKLNHLPTKSIFPNILNKVKKCYDYDINFLSKLITEIEKLLNSNEFKLNNNNKHSLITIGTFSKVYQIIKNIFYKIKEIDFKDELGIMFS